MRFYKKQFGYFSTWSLFSRFLNFQKIYFFPFFSKNCLILDEKRVSYKKILSLAVKENGEKMTVLHDNVLREGKKEMATQMRQCH